MRSSSDLRVSRALKISVARCMCLGEMTSLEEKDFCSFNPEPSPSQPCERGTSLWHR